MTEQDRESAGTAASEYSTYEANRRRVEPQALKSGLNWTPYGTSKLMPFPICDAKSKTASNVGTILFPKSNLSDEMF